MKMNEKKILVVIYSIIILFVLNDCINTRNNVDNIHETLFGIQCKKMEHGTIGFLSKSGMNVKLILFNYIIKLPEKTVSCRKIDEIINPKTELVHSFVWITEETLRNREKGSWKEPYFNCFSEDFLDLSNDKKIELFESLSK